MLAAYGSEATSDILLLRRGVEDVALWFGRRSSAIQPRDLFHQVHSSLRRVLLLYPLAYSIVFYDSIKGARLSKTPSRGQHIGRVIALDEAHKVRDRTSQE